MIENVVVTNTVTGRSVQIDMATSPYVLKSADFGQIQGTHQAYKYPSQIGSSLYSSNLGTRSVTIIGYVIRRKGEPANIVALRKQLLNNLINPLCALTIRANGKYNIDIQPTRSVKYAQTEEDNNEYMCKFEIVGTAYNPLFYLDATVVQAAGVAPSFHFPLIIPEEGIIMSERITTLICQFENIGAVETGLIIKLVAKGTVKNPSIVNIETQEALGINKEMVDGEVIIINTNESERSIEGTINGQTDNYLKYRSTTQKDWLTVRLGVNSFRYAVDEGQDNIDVSFIYRNKFLEVDQ